MEYVISHVLALILIDWKFCLLLLIVCFILICFTFQLR